MSDSATQKGHGRTGLKVAATLVLLALFGLAAGFGTWSAFSATTENTGNSFETGTVTISDNDSGTAMLALSAAKPGDSDTSCILVSYSGSLASSVRMYGATTGTGLDQYLTLTVTRGSGAAGYDNCNGFVPDATNYVGAGNGVVYNGTLRDFADDYGAGLVDPLPGTPESWTTGESHVYRFVVTVQDNNAAQGLTAGQTFTWEARNI